MSNNGAADNAGPIIKLVCLSRPALSAFPSLPLHSQRGEVRHVALTKALGLVKIKDLPA